MRFIMMAVLVTLSILLVSCMSGGNVEIDYNFKQGTPEMDVRLLDNAPPKNIYPLADFKIILELDNQAGYDITNGRARILGLDEKYFQIYPLEQPFDNMLGKSLTNPAGDKIFIEFEGSSGELFQNAEKYLANYFVLVNYNSKMEFAETVCINSNLYAVEDSGCKVQEKMSFSGQGAPLAVTKVEEIIYPGPGGEVEFRINLRGKGKGKVISASLGKAHLGIDTLECSFQGTGVDKTTIEFKDIKQEVTLICTRDNLPSRASYTTTLALDFTYEYELREQNKLTLIK
jgi:hypothetical protein